jgi:hypothetical protein
VVLRVAGLVAWLVEFTVGVVVVVEAAVGGVVKVFVGHVGVEAGDVVITLVVVPVVGVTVVIVVDWLEVVMVAVVAV